MTLTHVYSGKVRDVYGHGDGGLLMVASDRMRPRPAALPKFGTKRKGAEKLQGR